MVLSPGVVWTGAVSDDWSVGANWQGGEAPGAGATLVFPADASNFVSVDDLSAGTSFASIEIESSGYDISGASVELTGNLDASLTSGSSIYGLSTQLDDGVVQVASGGQLLAEGAFSGSAGLELTGGGGLILRTDAANTYSGDTTVAEGTLTLQNLPGEYAVPGDLVIGTTSTAMAIESNSYQINPDATVTVDGDGDFNVDGNSEVIGGLDLSGGALVYTGRADSSLAGLLTLDGDVSVDGSSGTPTFTGVLDLGPSDRTFDVTAGNINIDGTIEGTDALVKDGDGTLTLNDDTNDDPGAVDIDAGVLDFVGGGSIDERSTAGITVASGATMQASSVGSVTVPVSIVGDGYEGTGALHDSWWGDTFSDVILAGSAAIGEDDANPGVTITDALTDGGDGYSLTTVGGGEVDLAGDNSYSGGTTVSSGELYVSGTITGSVTVDSGAHLCGSGTVGSVTTDRGTVGAGNYDDGWDTEIETVSSLTLDSDATFNAQINGPSPGNGGFDQIVVSGAVALNDATLSIPSYTSLSNTVSIDLITGATSLTGTFDNLPEGAVVSTGGYYYAITYQGGTGGHDVVLNRVVPTTTSVAIPSNSSVYSQSDTFTATVDSIQGGTPTGTVTFYSGDTDLGDGTLNGDGVATVTTSVLPVGSDEVTAVYNGDANDYTSNSDGSPVTQVVIQDGSSTSVATSNDSTVYGQSVTFTATVTANSPGTGTPTGTVKFYDGTTLIDTATLDSGQATYVTSALAPGSHDISVSYAGDSGFFQSYSSTITQAVGQDDTTVSAPTSSGASTFGDSVTFTATVTADSPGSGTPTGTVAFYDGETELGTGTLDDDGTATFSTSGLTAGTHAISAEYGGNTNFASSTSATSTSQVVSQAGTTTGLATTPTAPATVPFGEPVTLTATVDPGSGSSTPTGTVTFYDGETELGTGTLDDDGVATLSVDTLGRGPHTITADYGGDTNFQSSTSSDASISVSLATATIAVTSTTNPAASNQSILLDATVSPAYEGAAAPTGSVTFYSGETSIGSGTLNDSGSYTLTLSPMAVGSYSITVDYGGDSNYQSGTSSALTLVVEQATTTTITPIATASTFGQRITLRASVASTAIEPGTPTGSVTFLDGTTVLGTAALNNSDVATLEISSLDAGTHTITAAYDGDSNFATSDSSTTTVTVDRSSTTTDLSSSVAAPVFGQTVDFTATVAAVAPGAGVPTGTVSFYDGATLLGTSTLGDSGTATYDTGGLTIGSQAIKAVYSGDANFSTSTSSSTSEDVQQASTSVTVISSDPTPTYGQSVTFTATVAPVTPGAGLPSGTLTFYAGTTPIGSADLAGSPASASITLSNLDAGTLAITVSYPGDADFVTSTSPAIGEVISPAATTTTLNTTGLQAIYGQPETLVATEAAVAPGVGTPTGTVDFFAGTTLIGSAPVVDGVATFQTDSIPTGSETLTAALVASTDFLASYSPPVGQVVTEATTTTALSGGGAAVAGQSLTFTATVAPVAPATAIPTGFVLFEDGLVPIGTAVLNAQGVATITTTSLDAGAHSITAVYGGEAGYSISTSAPASVSVAPSLSGTVYLDLDPHAAPGVGGPGVAGQMVFLDLRHDGVLDPGDPTAMTDADGQFSFPGYASGSAPVVVAAGTSTGGDYTVAQDVDAAGDVDIGVLPTSPVAPVRVAVNSAPSSPVPPSNPETAYIQSLYVAVYGQAGSASDVAYWVGRMDKGMTRRQVAERFIDSLPHRQGEVAAYYEEFLGRSPGAGANAQVRALMSGVSEERVVESILDSTEYERAHQDAALFATDLYLDVLGQAGTPAEVAGLESELASGMSRRAIVARFVESPAVDAEIVESFSTSYLHQQPDPATIRHWTAVLKAPGGAASEVAAGILSGRAFYEASQEDAS